MVTVALLPDEDDSEKPTALGRFNVDEEVEEEEDVFFELISIFRPWLPKFAYHKFSQVFTTYQHKCSPEDAAPPARRTKPGPRGPSATRGRRGECKQSHACHTFG